VKQLEVESPNGNICFLRLEFFPSDSPKYLIAVTLFIHLFYSALFSLVANIL
jgi:hypothetical protein